MKDDAKFCTNCGYPAEEKPQASGLTGTLAGSYQAENPRQEQQPYGNGGQNSGSYQEQQGYGGGYQQQGYGDGYQQQGHSDGYQQQGYGGYAPNSGYGAPYGGYPMAEKYSGSAIASLVLGLVGIFTGGLGASSSLASDILFGASSMKLLAILLYIPGILAAVLGIVGIVQGGKPGRKGRGMAIAGLVLGILFTALWFVSAEFARDTIFFW